MLPDFPAHPVPAGGEEEMSVQAVEDLLESLATLPAKAHMLSVSLGLGFLPRERCLRTPGRHCERC